jgi:hypothetical protein
VAAGGFAVAAVAGLTWLIIWAFSGGEQPPPPLTVRLERDPDKPDATEVTLSDGRKAWSWVRAHVGDEHVSFRLIFGGGRGNEAVEPFYIMESKVWNGLYRAAGMTPPAESEANGRDAPVMGLTADEAAKFAKGTFGGALPSPQQWDHAAGLYEVAHLRRQVARPGSHPRVMIARPAPTHGPSAREDVNEFGLLDMSGNGREWTAGVLTPPGTPAKVVGVDPLSPEELVILRGRNYTLSQPLTFVDLNDEQKTPQTHFASARSPYTGFRVVMPVP